MFDFHLHSSLSFDSECDAATMVKKAEDVGLKEICFTDHYDFHSDKNEKHELFTIEDYKKTYDHLTSDKVKIRRGIEFGLTDWNTKEFDDIISSYDFDFVIGSSHFVDGSDPYLKEFWYGLTTDEAFKKYLLGTLRYVKIHNNFDVLGHLTYVCKSPCNPSKNAVNYKDYSDITDEIMKILVEKGIGMEINTSGVDRVGVFLPSIEYLKRFKELGGEIVTLGSDSHDDIRIGQYSAEALEILKGVFGYVCTFENRKPIYHKL